MIKSIDIALKNRGRGFHLVTGEIVGLIGDLPENGLLHLFLHHTSAGLTINENADPSVRDDFETFINKMVPEKFPGYTHVFEGDDDMPAHIKSSLFGVELTIPIRNGRLAMGNWQGIYLCEFRNHGGGRNLTCTIYS